MREAAERAVQRLVVSLVETGAASAVVALTGGPNQIEWSHAAGWARPGRPAELATWFDYGSLTKPFAATLALLLDRSGELPLATRVGAVVSGLASPMASRQLSDLLRHRAGMANWTPFYAQCQSLAEVDRLLLDGSLPGARAGTYSDLDYILWGRLVERATGQSLAALVGERLLVPIGLAAAVAASPGDRPAVAESRMGGGREVELAARQGLVIEALPPPTPGQPQDGNARFLVGLAGRGGLPERRAEGASGARIRTMAEDGEPKSGGAMAGHCGLFGTAAALWQLGAEWLAPDRLLDKETVAGALAGGGPFALGWWRRRYRGSGGPGLSPMAFGHSGFAGGSLWIDPPRSRVLVLLAHRIEPSTNLNRWRRRFHSAVARTMQAGEI
jgi:serine-type D-Ala-D-Ala carboxypeptidase